MKTNVFCIIYATDGQPYLDYPEISDSERLKKIPFALAQFRWNGEIGFSGGGVEAGETPKEALIRELEEELFLYGVNPDDLVENTILEKDNITIISYKYLVPYNQLLLIQKDSLDADHFMAENTGTILLPLVNTGSDELDNVLENNFSYTARDELLVLINNLNK